MDDWLQLHGCVMGRQLHRSLLAAAPEIIEFAVNSALATVEFDLFSTNSSVYWEYKENEADSYAQASPTILFGGGPSYQFNKTATSRTGSQMLFRAPLSTISGFWVRAGGTSIPSNLAVLPPDSTFRMNNFAGRANITSVPTVWPSQLRRFDANVLAVNTDMGAISVGDFGLLHSVGPELSVLLAGTAFTMPGLGGDCDDFLAYEAIVFGAFTSDITADLSGASDFRGTSLRFEGSSGGVIDELSLLFGASWRQNSVTIRANSWPDFDFSTFEGVKSGFAFNATIQAGLSTAQVNEILVKMAAKLSAVASGTINLAGNNAAPDDGTSGGGDGLAAKTTIEGFGLTVTITAP